MLAIISIWPMLLQPFSVDSIPCTDTAVIRASRGDFLKNGGWTYDLYNTGRGLSASLQQNGVYLKQYGQTGLATFSVRGADPQQVQMVWNGIPLTNSMAGMTDLNTLGISARDELQISSGSTAGFYGSGNVGGSLLLHTREPDKNSLVLTQRSSTYGSYQQGLEAGWRKRKLTALTSTLYFTGNNRFPYLGYEGIDKVKLNMQNAASSRIFHRDMLSYNAGRLRLKAIAEYTANRRDPGQTISGPAGGTLWDRSTRALLEGKLHTSKGDFQLRSAWFNDFLRYRDISTQTDDTSRANIFTQQIEWVFKKKYFQWLAGADLQQISAKTESYTHKVNRLYPANLVAMIFHRSQWVVTSNARFEWYEKIPVFAASLQRSFSNWYTRGAVSTSFRRPALNDLYWLRNGNNALRAEKGKMAELGLGFKTVKQRYEYQLYVCGYRRELVDPIIWVPSGPNWEAVNLLRGEYTGIQFHGEWKYRFSDSTSIGILVNGDRVNAMMTLKAGETPGQRIFIPPFNGGFTGYVNLKNFRFYINPTYTEYRYTTNDNSASLPAYMLLNAGVSATHAMGKNWQANLGVDGLNLLNADYQVMPGRPMPLRGIEIHLKITGTK